MWYYSYREQNGYNIDYNIGIYNPWLYNNIIAFCCVECVVHKMSKLHYQVSTISARGSLYNHRMVVVYTTDI